MKKFFKILFTLLLFTIITVNGTNGQIIKSIKSSDGDFTTFTDAITYLNELISIPAGGIIFYIDPGFTSTEINLSINRTDITASVPVIFQKNGSGTNPQISNSAGGVGAVDYFIRLNGCDYVTFDGIDLYEIGTGTSTQQAEFGYYIINKSSGNGAQNNTIKNCNIKLNRTNINSLGIYQLQSPSAIALSGTNLNNKYSI